MYKPQEPQDGSKRLSEPADDKPKENLYRYRSGGYVKPEPPLTETKGAVDPKFGTRIEPDAAVIQNFTQSVTHLSLRILRRLSTSCWFKDELAHRVIRGLLANSSGL